MPTIPPPVPQGIMGLRKSVLLVGLGLVGLACVGSYLGVQWLLRPAPSVEKPRPAPLGSTMMTRRSAVLADEPRTYDQIPKPKPPPTMPLPPRATMVRPVEAATPPTTPPARTTVQPLQAPAGISPAEVEARIQAAIALTRAQMLEEEKKKLEAKLAQAEARGAAQPSQQGAAQPGQQDKPKGPPQWFGKIGTGKSMALARTKEEAQAAAPEKEEAQSLIARARWAKPLEVDRVLYWDMPLICQLQTGINSDIPGDVRCKVVRSVMDRELRGREIIPALTSVRGHQDGQVRFGQERLMVSVDEMIFPDGTTVKLPKSQLADPSGAAGIPADVDRHLGSLALGMLFSVGFNIGTRYATGSPQNYQYSNEQEIAREAGQAVNREAQQIAAQFRRPPTLRAAPGEEVLFYATENINFSKLPVTVR